MRGHNICFPREIRKIIIELSSIPPLSGALKVLRICPLKQFDRKSRALEINYVINCNRYTTHQQKYYHVSLVVRLSCFLPNDPKCLDPSYKMDLDLWDCLGRVKFVL